MTSREDVTAVSGRAIVAAARRVGLGLVVGAVVLGSTACSGGDDDNPLVDEQAVLDVETATAAPVCMQVDDDLPPQVTKLPIIDCAEVHSHEIYATIRSPEEVFPGVEALGDFAQVRCLEAFEPFVGVSAFDSALSFSWLVPTLGSWNDEGDREILCVLMPRDGSPLVGTMRGSLA